MMQIYTTMRAKAIPQKCNSRPKDWVAIRRATTFLQENGYPVTTKRLYNLSAAKKVPRYKWGQYLIFSKSELLDWAEKMIVKQDTI